MKRRSGIAFFMLSVLVLAGRSEVSSATGSTPAASASATQAPGSKTRGVIIFATNCAVCHGATGEEGGVGPPLRDEQKRKNYDATISWIKNPAPPMPKLYPSPLSAQDVADVAAYVQSL